MPAQLSYPGVYIEEIPSGVRTITGVATSIAAFVGWAAQGPTDEARRVTSWEDFSRAFGGLDPRSHLSYAVSHFFMNGGQQAYIIRLPAEGDVKATLTLGGLTLEASGPGPWANQYGVIATPREDAEGRFGLTIFRGAEEKNRLVAEVFQDLSLDPTDVRYVKGVIDEASRLVNASEVDAAGGTPETDGAGEMLDGGVNGDPLDPSSDAATFWAAVNPDVPDDGSPQGGVYLLDRIDLFNLLVVPGFTDGDNLQVLADFCKDRRAFLIADAPDATNYDSVQPLSGLEGTNAAIYYPWIMMSDPGQEGRLRPFPPSGAVAGIYARTDTTRGVWKAPAGTEATITGARKLTNNLTDAESGVLNPRGVNALRNFEVYGPVVWGARTCQGNDQIGSEWKYVPVRRTALFLEETLYRSLKWVVFEPNDEPLWAQIRLNVGAFMHDQFRKGAFQGKSPREAYFVKCDGETTTQSDINLGIVNILVGFAPLKPAEFVVVKLQQMAGQLQA
jgi:uncharacterized protein